MRSVVKTPAIPHIRTVSRWVAADARHAVATTVDLQEPRLNASNAHWSPVRLKCLVIEWNDHLVGANQAEVLADHFIGQVGIGPARIEQRRFVAKTIALGFQRR